MIGISEFLFKLYKNRFSENEVKQRDRVWRALCVCFLQKFIDRDAIVLDIGAGYGEFINNIKCKVKYALDLNNDCAGFLNPDVKFFADFSYNLSFLSDNSVDAVFMSNFSEHLKSKEEMVATFLETKRVLNDKGKLIILGPNIRYAYKEYWDYFDHHIPLSDKGMVEVLRALDFKVVKVIPRFLPYTSKSRIPKHPILVKLYLAMPILWNFVGKQMFILASK